MLQAFELQWRFVGSENELLSKLVQVVEYEKEGVLCTFLVGKVLNVVNYEHIYRLIEGIEVVGAFVEHCRLILHLEGVG